MHDDYKQYSPAEFLEAIGNLPNDTGLRLWTRMTDDFVRVLHLDPEAMAEWNKDQTLLNIVCPAFRDEVVQPFGLYLEHTYFDPDDNELNDQFWQTWYTWDDIPWNIITIPVAKANCAFLSATATGTRLADGIPHVFSSGIGKGIGSVRVTPIGLDWRRFPLDNKNTFALQPDTGPNAGPSIGGVAFRTKPGISRPKQSVIDELLKQHRKRK